MVYNWVDEKAVVNVPRQDNKLFDKYNLDRNKFYVTYSGNLGLSQNLELLCNVANRLKDYQDIQFVLIGEGAYKDELEKRISKWNSPTLRSFDSSHMRISAMCLV